MKKHLLFYLAGFMFVSMQIANAQSVKRDTTFKASGNPVFKHKYTADPGALVHGDKLYIYAGHDECPAPQHRYVMNEWCVFSTEDLETWTEHPTPLRPADFSWSQGDAWASQVIERNGKFYWYVSTTHKDIHGKAIGVAVSDSPVGPFKDIRGSALITNDMTTAHTKISWDDIDPTVWIDDDGQAYLIWGNTQCYYIKLKENMIETEGEIMTFDLPRFTEAPWVHKRGKWFYLSYASEFPEKIVYAMSKSITGPWEYKGLLNEIAGNSNTNHQAIVQFKGKWYFIYHNGGINNDGGSYRRSVCIDYLHYNRDGSLKRVQMTTEGVKPIKKK